MTKDISRYHRQYLFQKIGEEGQRKLSASRIAIIGCGALGTVLINTLARAGVGFIRVVDRDFIELNNLQRQVLFDEDDIKENLPKAIAAERKVKRINSTIKFEAVVSDVNFTNIEQFIKDVDLVLDGTDNFETRFLMNDACVKLGKPWIYGAVIGSHGLTMTIIPGETPCLRCVFESAPPPELTPTCDTAGIIAPASVVIASLESTEAIKFLSGNKKDLNRSLYSYDVWTREAKSFRLEGLREATDCPTCKSRNFEFLTGDKTPKTTTLCGRNAVQITRSDRIKLDFKELAHRFEKVGEAKFNPFMFQAKVDGYEFTIFPDGRAIIKGTNDPAQAKTIYSKYIGV
ncbi:MAG: thiamine biosynthesis protein ThiF [Omnitrophica bacterium RIFCSPHIGHO2_02_FULL_46_11]|nr:MAG: thiamine biosynthesis protein ThiF [Omnitrophica bacterium RIFCSPHIGHO2_02_FULL_46_11]OGW87757.1 MAG: thiamine biosynthesis protein ThiF [Omnitrophica bacterium RIFCSPLOWO2_01_FULL_45_10b]